MLFSSIANKFCRDGGWLLIGKGCVQPLSLNEKKCLIGDVILQYSCFFVNKQALQNEEAIRR